MDRARAWSRWLALRRMTTERGCTGPEAATAARLAAALDERFAFTRAPRPWRSPEHFDEQWSRAERRAATRWHWEYRHCFKPRCHCARERLGHGPYKYAKRRLQDKVVSIYLGRT
jgi:hypothetical protein